jgi:hypothetical protein
MAKKSKVDVNLLELVPRRIAEHEIDGEGIVTILMQRFRNRYLERLFVPRFRSKYIRINLDEIGSEVWLLCDGRRSVGEIAAAMRERFEERVEPCADRLAIFFGQLQRAHFIEYANLEQRLKAGA